MNQVKNDVTDTVDTVDYVWQFLLSVWESFPLELKAFLLTMFVISILMEWVKKALLANKTKRERIRLLWLSSLPLGTFLTLIGYYLDNGTIHDGYWAIIGLTVGTSAMGVHYITMKIVIPLMKAIWGRILLFARGY